VIFSTICHIQVGGFFTKLREIIYTSKRALSNFGIVLDPNQSGYLDSGSITRYGLKSRMTLVCIKDYLRC